MSHHFLAVYYEGDMVEWLQNRFPTVEVFAIATVGHSSHHILVSKLDSNTIKDFLVRDLEPPFCRRISEGSRASHPAYEPGFDFCFDDGRESSRSLRRIVTAYKSLHATLPNSESRDYVYQRAVELAALMTQQVRL